MDLYDSSKVIQLRSGIFRISTYKCIPIKLRCANIDELHLDYLWESSWLEMITANADKVVDNKK